MKTKAERSHQFAQGFVVLMAMIISGITLLVLAGVLILTSGGTQVTARNNSYSRSVTAAEAATESVMAKMNQDFMNQSFSSSDPSAYQQVNPATYLPGGWTSDYAFCDTNGTAGRTSVAIGTQFFSTNLDSSLAGLYGYVFPCRVIATARPIDAAYDTAPAAVQQDFELAGIPIFQFQTFYSLDLEINPGPNMTINGKVHGNADIYVAPGASLEFKDGVESVGQIYNSREVNDPNYGSAKTAPIYDVAPTRVSALSLPIGTNNSPDAVVQVLDPPPLGEDPNSALASQRYYNNVDIIVTTSASGVVSVNSGRWNNFALLTPDVTNSPPTYSFIKTSPSFYDGREKMYTITTEVNVGSLISWLTNAGAGMNRLTLTNRGHGINSIYVNDLRTASGKLTVVRVTNGRQLPPYGLTIATRLPLYVQGHYNAPDISAGLTNTTATLPASLVGDAITVLSAAWTDPGTTQGTAANTTVNAAFLAGIVPTTISNGTKHYSGGLENFPRLLENWNGITFTYNGSMVVMFPSRYAKSFWSDPGSSGYYGAPTRKWAFDLNFLDHNKLPPVTPQVKKLLRQQWSTVAVASRGQ